VVELNLSVKGDFDSGLGGSNGGSMSGRFSRQQGGVLGGERSGRRSAEAGGAIHEVGNEALKTYAHVVEPIHAGEVVE
jgi:hypothetical protein